MKIFRYGFLVVLVVIMMNVTALGQTTYVWTGATDNAWTTTTNWNPTRTTPASNDIIQFSAGGTTTVTAVPTQTIGQLSVSGNSTVNLQASGSVTLTITGTGSVFSVASGSALNCNVANAITMNITTGGTGTISGSMTLSAAAHRFTAADASGITFQNGSTFTEGTAFSGNPFGTTNLNSVVFASGSTFVYIAGSNPFGASQPSSVVVFQSGSLYSHQSSSSPGFSGRTYANFELNIAATTITVTGTSAISINNLTITAGTLNFNMTASPGHAIKGNISVASGATLTFSPSSAGTVNFNGASGQTISGSGTLTTTANSTIVINNSNGITLGKNIAILGTLNMTSGNIALGGNTLTLGASAGAPGTLSYTAGFLTGTGTFTRWFGTSAVTLPSVTGQFPMGVGSNNRNLWISGTPSTGGTISVQYNDASTKSVVSISDNSSTYVNRYDANWVITTANSFAGTTLGLQIQGSGIPGISATSDLNITGASAAATGTYVTPTGTTAAPVLQRSSIADQTALASTYYVSALSGSALPVELTSFNATVKGRGVELAWKTATEVNNAGFEIEKRAMDNGKLTIDNWEKIGFVEGHGTTNAPQSYSYVDASAKGTVSYRLKQIDRDGKFEYSNTVEVKVGLTAEDFKLTQNFPNPFNPNTTITFAMKTAEHVNVTVYNALGQSVATLYNGIANPNELYSLTFDGKNLSSGTYFYALRSATRNEVRKMMLTK